MVQEWASQLTGSNLILFNVIFIILMLWALVWKGIALWKAARNADKIWFIALLIVNTIGILEILYIYVFSKKSRREGRDSDMESSEKSG